MNRFRGRKMSWDPRSLLLLSQLPLQADCYITGKQTYGSYEYLGDTSPSLSCSCPNLLEADDPESKIIHYLMRNFNNNSP